MVERFLSLAQILEKQIFLNISRPFILCYFFAKNGSKKLIQVSPVGNFEEMTAFSLEFASKTAKIHDTTKKHVV